jgi:hypothetical protein
MFNIGATYTLKMWEDSDNEGGILTDYPGCKIVEADSPRIKYRQGKKEIILNTASLAFVSATREPQ